MQHLQYVKSSFLEFEAEVLQKLRNGFKATRCMPVVWWNEIYTLPLKGTISIRLHVEKKNHKFYKGRNKINKSKKVLGGAY